MGEGLYLKYFVIKPHGTDAYAKASRMAMYAYADHIMEHNRELALDLVKLAQEAERKAE